MANRQAQHENDRAGLTPDTLESGGLMAFLNTLRTATSIIGVTDALLREAGVGLNTREWDALVFISAYGPIRPSELMRHLALTHSAQTLSSLVDRLESRGLVHRSADATDSRAVLIESTDDARQLVTDIYPIIERRVINPFLGPYTEAEIDSLGELLGRQLPT